MSLQQVRLGTLVLGRPSGASLRALLASQASASLTYPGIGATLRGGAAPGWPVVTGSAVVGHGDDDWDDARAAIRAWAMHHGAGFSVEPDEAPIAVGTQVAVVAGRGPLALVACCRVVAVVDEADRFGFAYGTLPVHPERGEEAFVVRREPDGTVICTVHAFARARSLPARLAGPLGRRLQARAVQRYLDAVAAFVAGHT